jgi:hypothetical protein
MAAKASEARGTNQPGAGGWSRVSAARPLTRPPGLPCGIGREAAHQDIQDFPACKCNGRDSVQLFLASRSTFPRLRQRPPRAIPGPHRTVPAAVPTSTESANSPARLATSLLPSSTAPSWIRRGPRPVVTAPVPPPHLSRGGPAEAGRGDPLRAAGVWVAPSRPPVGGKAAGPRASCQAAKEKCQVISDCIQSARSRCVMNNERAAPRRLRTESSPRSSDVSHKRKGFPSEKPGVTGGYSKSLQHQKGLFG